MSTKPCRNNSRFLLFIKFADGSPQKEFYAFSFQNEEDLGAETVFQRMKRRLLIGKYNNNYTTARFYDLKNNPDHPLHELYAGTQRF